MKRFDTRKMPSTPLGKFIFDEISKRGMSEREFASMIGVSSSTVNAYVTERTDHDFSPTLPFLRKLARGTGVPLATIIALAYPDVAGEIDVDPEALLLAKEFSRMPQSVREVIKTILKSFAGDGQQKGE